MHTDTANKEGRQGECIQGVDCIRGNRCILSAAMTHMQQALRHKGIHMTVTQCEPAGTKKQRLVMLSGQVITVVHTKDGEPWRQNGKEKHGRAKGSKSFHSQGQGRATRLHKCSKGSMERHRSGVQASKASPINPTRWS